MAEIKICPECGGEEKGHKCLCGYTFTRPASSIAEEYRGKRKANPALALLPAVLLIAATGVFVANQTTAFSRVASVISPGSRSGKLDCVDTYGVTLQSSEMYVREGLVTRPKNAPTEMSTVVRGMARNNCGKPLSKVTIRINVEDEAGKKGSGWASIPRMGVGEVKSFERAWMGRVTSYRIVEIR